MTCLSSPEGAPLQACSLVSSIWTADGCLMSDMDRQRAHCAEYFEQLNTTNPPNGQLQTSGLQIVMIYPLMKPHPLLVRSEVEAWQRHGKAAGICNINAELFNWNCNHDSQIACSLDCHIAIRYHSSWLEWLGHPHLEKERGPSKLQYTTILHCSVSPGRGLFTKG